MHSLLYRRHTNWVIRPSTFLESTTSSWHQLGVKDTIGLFILLLGLIGYPGIMPGGRWAARVGWRKGIGNETDWAAYNDFNAPLMTFTPAMFFSPFIMLLLLLVLADLHGEMGGGSGLLDGCISMKTACFFPLFFFSFYISFFVQPFEPSMHEG